MVPITRLILLATVLMAWSMLSAAATQQPDAGAAAGQAAAPAPSFIPPPRGSASPMPAEPGKPAPFGANLFTGNFLKTRQDGLNPEYRVMQGDQIAVHAWGSVEINDLFTVDGQGNIFIPGIGPVRVQGVRNANLTEVVRNKVKETYINSFEVYTNLVTAQPVLVYVTGAVNHPGRYGGLPSDSVLFFLDLAGGVDPALGSYRDIEIRRAGKRVARVDLYDFLLHGTIPSLQFRDGDTVLVKKRGPVVALTGNVPRDALIELTADMRRGEHLLAVLPGSAGVAGASITGFRNGRPFTETLSLTDFAGRTLEDGDAVRLNGAGLSPTILVNIEGEHQGAPVLGVRRGARLVDVLNHLHVDPTLADTGAVHLRRASVAAAQRDSINDALFRLERDALLALSDSAGEAAIRVQEAELTQKFVERARNIDPLGRVVTTRGGAQQNILLEAGDTIVIPVKTGVVRVSGQVTMAQAVTHQPDWTIADYIEQAGGYSDRADQDRLLILKPSAEIVAVNGDGATISAGDEILVLPRIDNKTLQNAADIMEIIYRIAISAAVVLDAND
jgi:protein involved in polysaccharide export with SLBB domain